MGNGSTFRVPCRLVHNGVSISVLSLPDTGASLFICVDTRIAESACERTGAKKHSLAHPIRPKGYNGVPGRIITHFVLFDLFIDGYTLLQIPFLILDHGNHDVILGEGFMAHFDILPDMRHRKLIWRTKPEPTPSFARQLTVPRSALLPRKPSLSHQYDSDRRTKAIEADDKRRSDGQLPHIALLRESPLKPPRHITFTD